MPKQRARGRRVLRESVLPVPPDGSVFGRGIQRQALSPRLVGVAGARGNGNFRVVARDVTGAPRELDPIDPPEGLRGDPPPAPNHKSWKLLSRPYRSSPAGTESE